MTCSPKIKGERLDVGQRACNSECFYWELCLKELNIKEAPEEPDTRFKKPIKHGV
jgi:hypothetical protein